MRRNVKQIPNANAKESTETNLLRLQYRPVEEGLIGGELEKKRWEKKFSSFFLRVTGSGKMCEMLLTISFNFKLISANCLAVNAASHGPRTDSSKSPPTSLSSRSHSQCHCHCHCHLRRQALRSLQFCYRNSHMHARLACDWVVHHNSDSDGNTIV